MRARRLLERLSTTFMSSPKADGRDCASAALIEDESYGRGNG
jgi:hypothetical protein